MKERTFSGTRNKNKKKQPRAARVNKHGSLTHKTNKNQSHHSTINIPQTTPQTSNTKLPQHKENPANLQPTQQTQLPPTGSSRETATQQPANLAPPQRGSNPEHSHFQPATNKEEIPNGEQLPPNGSSSETATNSASADSTTEEFQMGTELSCELSGNKNLSSHEGPTPSEKAHEPKPPQHSAAIKRASPSHQRCPTLTAQSAGTKAAREATHAEGGQPSTAIHSASTDHAEVHRSSELRQPRY